MAILVSWLLCFIFTVTNVFPPEVGKYGYYARTDARQGIVAAAPWFKVPYPCECVSGEDGGGLCLLAINWWALDVWRGYGYTGQVVRNNELCDCLSFT